MSYILKRVPKSTKQVIDAASQDKVITTVKNAMANYVKSFLDTMGVNRAIAEQVGSNTLQYITDKDINLSKDPTKRQLEIAKLSEEIKERVPAILIADTGLIWNKASVGDKEQVRYDGKDVIETYAFIFTVPVSIHILMNDEATAKDFAILLSLMFGPLHRLAGGSEIKSDDIQSKWVITLPINFTPPTMSQTLVQEANVDNIWHGELTLDLMYENLVDIRRTQPVGRDITGIVNADFESTNIIFPDEITVGTPENISFLRVPPSFDWHVINDDRVVTFDKGDITGRITGIKPGTFSIIAKDEMRGTVLARKDVTVKL